MTIKSLFFITHTEFCFLSLLFYKEEWGLQLSERRHCVNYFHQLVNVAGWSWNPFYAFSANLLIPFIIPCFSISFLQLPVFIYRSEMTLFSKTCFAILFKKIFFKVSMTSVQHFMSPWPSTFADLSTGFLEHFFLWYKTRITSMYPDFLTKCSTHPWFWNFQCSRYSKQKTQDDCCVEPFCMFVFTFACLAASLH